MNHRVLAPSLLAVVLGGCVTGGNIKGDFQCAAPGGSCAPMSVIDAAAVASIGTAGRANTSVLRSDTPTVPRTVSGSLIADGLSPSRTSDRVLRVVFPAHIDEDGIYREESAAHAVVENTTWADALTGVPTRPKRVSALREAGVVPTAAEGSALASLDEVVAFRAARRAMPAAPQSSISTSGFPGGRPGRDSASPRAVPPVSLPDSSASFDTSGSRAAVPLSLAEAASGLTAPTLLPLDPRRTGSYDTSDVATIVDNSGTGARGLGKSKPVDLLPPPEVAGRETASKDTPYGSRKARWNGKHYRTPQSSAATRSAVPARSATADLNRTSVQKHATRPLAAVAATKEPAAIVPDAKARGATSDAREAQKQVRDLAAPFILSATENGREAARAAALQGSNLPLADIGGQVTEPRR